MQINIGARTISELFSEGNTVAVPSFQRNYSWTKDQIEQFLSDIYESAESNQPHFWGPIVLLRLPTAPNDFQIIDGQQRITTVMIFISLVRDAALSLTDRIINPGSPGSYDIAPSVRNFIFQPPNYVAPRFTGSYLIEEALTRYILADPESLSLPGNTPVLRPKVTKLGAGMAPNLKLYTKELRAAYLQMRDSLAKKLEDLPEPVRKNFLWDLFKALTTQFVIHTMELNNEDDAYVLFESLNDRGLKLNPSDLLKTFTLREIRNMPSPISVDQALVIWDNTVENLGDYDFTKFLRHYLLTQTEESIQARKIFGHFKKQISDLGNLGALTNLNRIKDASDRYAQLLGVTNHSDKQMRESFERINVYSDTHRVFLLGLLESGLDLDSLRLLTRAIEFLSFRWIAAGSNAQALETLYQKLVGELRANPTAETANAIKAQILMKAPNDSALSDLTRNSKSELQRYVLRRIETTTGGAIAGTPTIEHLAPQTPPSNDPYWYSMIAQKETADSLDYFYDDYVNKWGNLTLLEDKLNQSIQNSQWPQKLTGNSNYKGISASNYNINNAIKVLPEWTAELILKREQYISGCIRTLVGSGWVETGVARIQMWDGT